MPGLFQHPTPVRHHIGPFAVNVQPREALGKRAAMQDASLRPVRSIDIEKLGLQREHLMQPFDVSPRDREQAQFDAPLERIGCEPLPPGHESHRYEERAGQDGVGQGIGRVVEASAVAIERRDGAAEGVMVRRQLRA